MAGRLVESPRPPQGPSATLARRGVARGPRGPVAGEQLAARKVVEQLADLGLDADRIAAATGLDAERIAAALAEKP